MGSDADRELLLPVSHRSSLEGIVDQAVRAESLGYERLSMGETTGWNQVATLAILARETDRIGLADDVLSPYARSPVLLGQTAATLAEASGGRFRLGLGTSSPALVEGWHGATFDRPLRRLRETIDIVRLVLSGERVAYDGQLFSLDGLRPTCEMPDSPVPIDVAALGPKTVELAGRFADGWVPQLLTPDGVKNRLSDLERGAALGDRDPSDVRVTLTVRACAHEDGDRAREIARRSVGFLIGAYGPYYRQSIASQGYAEAADRLHETWREHHDPGRLAAAVPDDLLADVAITGTPEEAREQLAAFETIDGVDAVRVGFFRDQPVENMYETMAVLAPRSA